MPKWSAWILAIPFIILFALLGEALGVASLGGLVFGAVSGGALARMARSET